MDLVSLLVKHEERISITWTPCTYDKWGGKYSARREMILSSASSASPKYTLPCALKCKVTTVDPEIFEKLQQASKKTKSGKIEFSDITITEKREVKYGLAADKRIEKINEKEQRRIDLFRELTKIGILIDEWHDIDPICLSDEYYNIEKKIWKPGEMYIFCNEDTEIYKELKTAGLLDKYVSDSYKKGIL